VAGFIHHWGSYFGERTLDAHAQMNPNGMLERDPPARGLHKDTQAVARVSGSVWIVDCPSGDGGAEFVNFEDPRFFCCSCRNRAWGHQPIPVTLPDPALRLAVEEILVKRPDPRTRNWTPDETVDDLKLENLERGVKP
jgi:hypothetical protein